jgi:hypothetical protein
MKYLILRNTAGNSITFITDEDRAKLKKNRGEEFEVLGQFEKLQEAQEALAELANPKAETPQVETPKRNKIQNN